MHVQTAAGHHFAIYVENALKFYASKTILNNFSMHVPHGTIYGLLGASGCGKTTLLNCLVGIKRLKSGKLCVLGNEIGVANVPLSRIGYMPQDIGLTFSFTIKEAVYYFGKIFGIPCSSIGERFESLTALLDLPASNKLIKNCSGGEQRRVSLACALINNPDLLILDEPTVGLDPILREVIWSYLLRLTKLESKTVIITTHYIEEARQAHKVGFMREGKLLAEDAPEKLLSLYEASTLEKVFLILSKQQLQSTNADQNANNVKPSLPEHFTKCASPPKKEVSAPQSNLKAVEVRRICYKYVLGELSVNKNRFQALLTKNRVQLSRNICGTVFTLLFPVISMLALLTAVGNDVKDINIAIVNHEHPFDYCRNIKAPPCMDRHLSCKYIDALSDPMIIKNYYNKTEEALNELKHGNVWSVLYIPPNFSESVHKRSDMGFRAQDSVLNSSQIVVWIDMSNKQIGNSLKIKLRDKLSELLSTCNHSSFDSIINVENVLYGTKSDKFSTFLIPGMLLTIIFFMSVTNTVDTIITDRLGGTWHRSTVAGVSSLEIILTHFITQLLIIVVQLLELLILTFFIYKTEYIGNLAEIMLILLLGGIVGMSYGFWISVSCKNHSFANFLTTGSFYPLIIVSGVLWPLEGMSKVMQYCGLSLPIALPTLSLRNIMRKGWNLTRAEVLNGVGVQILWILLLGIVCIYQLKKNK